VGGFWGPELKYAGYDNLVIIGKSKNPVYIYIHDNHVEIRKADFLWGKDVYETENILRKMLGDEHIKIACIGPAGENRVRGSAIIMDTAKAAGGSGVGCVMGDKKLKAIVVRGHGNIEAYQPEQFIQVINRCYEKCKEEKNSQMMRKAPFNLYADPEWQGWNTNIVVKNGQDDQWEKEKRIKLMNTKNGIPHMLEGVRACYCCPIGCMPYMKINNGKYKGTQGEGFWINTIMGHACRFDISDPEDVLESWLLTNKLGLDGDYVAAGLSWIFELYEKGIITRKDTDGLELQWGDGNALIQMIKKLAYREGIGDLLADGIVEAARKIGHNSESYLIQVKGQPSIEPFRVPKGWALAVSTSPVAGRHLRGATMGSERYGAKPRPGNFNVIDYENQVDGVVWQGKTKELEDNLGICNYVGTWSGANFLTINDFLELIKTGMGIDLTEQDLMDHFAEIGRNLEIAFNALHTNLSRKDDFPPKRFFQEEVKTGPYKGFKINKEKYSHMLDRFYELWGCDMETGMQTRSNLERVGLEEIAEKLSKQGKLIED
jgi:aldehyde:ferredoxin oxidoreductase